MNKQTTRQRLLLYFAIVILATGITWALQAQNKPKEAPKTYSVTLSLNQWQSVINGLEAVKSAVKTSNMPANQATYISDSIILTYQMEFSRQIQFQVTEENKKDSLVKPKKN